MFLTTVVRPVPLNLIGHEPMNTYVGNNVQNYWGQIYLLPCRQGEETGGKLCSLGKRNHCSGGS